jgi:hypothetical protein
MLVCRSTNRSWGDLVREGKARMAAERDAIAAMEALGPDADAESRRAALTAALAARGVERSPLWIEHHAVGRPEDRAGWGRFVTDAARVFRRIGHDDTEDSEPVPGSGHGPWQRVTLRADAVGMLDRAYHHAEIRLADLAMVTVILRSTEAAEPPAVLVNGVEVGHLVPGAGPWDDVAVTAQVARIVGPIPYLMQLRLP